jgi:hypothetical protein
MKKITLLFILFTAFSYSQTNKFSSAWTSEGCVDCYNSCVFTLNLVQNKSKIYGTAEIDMDNYKSGILDVRGYVKDGKAYVRLSDSKGICADGMFLLEKKNTLFFHKKRGMNFVPNGIYLYKTNI